MNGKEDKVLQHCLNNRSELLTKLSDYVKCQSVSTDPAYASGMEDARLWLEHYLSDIGFENVQRLNAAGHPSIFAQWMHAPDMPTLLVYGHYDVQHQIQ